MERTQTQTQTPLVTYQHICYRADVVEVIYCPDINRFCIPEKIGDDYIKYNVQPNRKYIALKYTNDVLSYCVDVELMETDEEGVITENGIFKQVCNSIDMVKKVPRVIREFASTILNNYEYHCYLKSSLEILEHVLSELAKRQFSELDTLELLRWLESQDP